MSATTRLIARRFAALSALLCSAFVRPATAAIQYDMVLLDAGGSTVTEAYSIDHGRVAGVAGLPITAAVWPRPGQLLNLPSGGYSTSASGIFGDQVVGGGISTQEGHALLWNGTASGPVDLTPAGSQATADATDGSQQVGVTFGAVSNAALWSGTAGSYVNLHPSNERASLASGVSGGIQVGRVNGGRNPGPFWVPGLDHAAIWRGTAASYEDINPQGIPPGGGNPGIPAAAASAAGGISHGQIAGYAAFDAFSLNTQHAGFWTVAPDGSVSPNSFVDLHPAGKAVGSGAGATNGVQQVGLVWTGLNSFSGTPIGNEACVWHGSASTFQVLPVPAGYKYSAATGIDADGNISGIIGPDDGGGTTAVTWVPHRLPGDANFDGTVGFDDLVIVARNYGKVGGELGWVDGDFLDEGRVGFDDLLMVAKNYQGGAPSASQLAQFDPAFQADVERAFADVPEPVELPMLSLAMCVLRRVRPC